MMRKPTRKIALISLTVLVLVAVAVGLKLGWHDDEAPDYRLAQVERGAIVSTVTASGTLGAVVTVQVGSQISGQLKDIYADFNSEVKAGELIARLDPATFESKLMQSEANLALAQASVKTKRAAVVKARATVNNTQKGLQRQRDLARQGVASASALDNAEALFNTTQAELAMAEAEVENALAQVGAQESLVNQARIDLERTYIRAPVDGTVISRDVDRGQTVAASLQAPILFKIAQDLRAMQVEVRVDEADVGRIRQNQRATFTVDSFPGREFHGRVEQIRKAALVVQNVVTYSVLVSTANDDLRLLPGLTANVRIIVDERPDTLKVANAALRFRPTGVTESPTNSAPPPGAAVAASRVGANGRPPGAPPGPDRLAQLTELLNLSSEQQAQVKALIASSRERSRAARQGGESVGAAAQARSQFDSSIIAILSPEQRETYQASREGTATRRGQVWVVDGNGGAQPVELVIGISDGSATEVVSGDIQEGESVIIGYANPTAKRSGPRGLPGFGR